MGAPIIVESYRLHRTYLPALHRTEQIADQAARLVTRRMRERLPHVTIRISGERLLGQAVTEVEQQLLGTDRLPSSGSQGRHVYGVTTLGPAGAVVVINGKAVIEDRCLATTLVHELVHAVQGNRPGGQQRLMTGIRGAFGFIKGGPSRQFIRRHDRDEREAQSLEHLASELR
ncbi:hypothetical protein ACFWG6_30970 [Streptomyces erythrochromogenes]|uniref:hypothetical protein n=1 Tax=Streptomyces erythrochromogenes TaxID=285574 RepID=UPI00362C2A22